MLPGAPRVYYTCHTIEYDFGNNGITIRFCCLGKATVEYRNGPAFGSHAEKVCIKVKETATHLVERTGAKEGCQKVAEGAKNVTVTAIDHTADLAKIAITPLQQAAKLIPGINMLKSTPEDQAQRLRDAQLRAAQFQAEKQGATIQGVTIPTNR
jgi:hypothetical protein